ncbi:MAG: type I restriction endonuclease subunit R [Endomicrobia bacterium]|nr:type I restriction endonuclease subunit R [Endomicrobiia bacterium]MCL2507259.1 type I restriction endonuclease subunit R [Endomicrobiia bacterium]
MQWFEDIGYQTFFGPDVLPDTNTPLRADIKDVVLKDNLKASLKNINPQIADNILNEAFDIISKPNETSIIANNKKFYTYFTEGVKVLHKNDNGADTATIVKLFDFENVKNNEFIAINQFTIAGKQNRRPDIIVFINGLPLAVIELKNPAEPKADIHNAFNQIQTYKNDIEDLFYYNLACVVADGAKARLGSLTGSMEWFLPWRTIAGEREENKGRYEEEVLIKGFFNKEFILDYIRYYVIFEDSGKDTIKKIAGYHQFHAVRKAVKTTIQALNKKDGKAGVVWHTQGAGKSISMLCFASKIMQAPEMENPTIVVVTDRNDLDTQLFDEFAKGNRSLSPIPVDSREDLQEKLTNKPSGGVFFTTIQKFYLEDNETTFPVLSNRKNIVVISDEAHRSHYGFNAKISAKGNITYGYAKYLRDALPNACFIGFTGTPIETTDKDTRAVFGDYIDIYDIVDAINDGATVPIYYEARQIPINTKDGKMLEIDEQIEEVTEGMDDKEKVKTRWATVEALIDTEPRLKTLAKDLIEHFEDRCSVIDGKGLIVCISRKVAVHLYEEIVKLRPTWHSNDPQKGAIKVVMTGSASDPLNFQPHLHNNLVKKDLEKRFKKFEDPLKLVIVCDMWLTGFNVPSLHTMYIDKPMKGHSLMQAIARVNRVFRDKQAGLIVDYIGIARNLEKAVANYTTNGGRGNVEVDIERAYEELLKHIEVCRECLDKFDYSEFKTKAFELLPNAMDYILSKQKRDVFCDSALNATKAYGLCKGKKETRIYNDELAFFQYIRSMLIKSEYGDGGKKSTDPQVQSVIKAIIDNAIISDKVVDVFKSVGLEKPDISLISDEFLERVKNIEQKNLAVELLERLINGEIKTKFRLNIALQQKFSDLLKNVITKYNNGTIETAQVIEELINTSKDINAAIKEGAELGLSDAEKAFYDAIIKNEASVRSLGNDTLKQIARELTEYLRKSTKVDWAKRDNVRAAIRIAIKGILRKYKYPPDEELGATERVLEQAEKITDEMLK